jgi:hypothetical protein
MSSQNDRRRTLAVVAGVSGLLVGVPIATAAPLVVYEFGSGTTGSNAPTIVAPSVVSSASDFVDGGGLVETFNTSSVTGTVLPTIQHTGNSTGSALLSESAAHAATDYYTFSITPASALTIGGISFDISTSYAAQASNFPQVYVRSDAGGDNFQTPLGGAIYSGLNSANQTLFIDLRNVAALQNITGTTTFHLIQADGATGTGAFIRLDNVTLDTVPEPSALAILALGGISTLARRRK